LAWVHHVTIEELDDQAESPPATASPFGLSKLGRLHLLAVAAGILLGLTVVAAASSLTSTDTTAACQRTTTRDASGVITVDGNLGIVGDTFTRSGDGSFLVVRRGAVAGDGASLQFTQIGTTAPATWVRYHVTASTQGSKTPWGDAVAFPAGWKPIAFAKSCWRLIVDGTDSGLVLAVGESSP
jgi:hypothetical protein